MSNNIETDGFVMRDTDLPNTKYHRLGCLSEQGMLNAWNDIDMLKQIACVKNQNEADNGKDEQ